jgi:hypothetical protein
MSNSGRKIQIRDIKLLSNGSKVMVKINIFKDLESKF